MSAVEILAHICGFFGMICVVLAFYMCTIGKWPNNRQYFICNLVGAILLLLSLCVHFNLGSFIIELFWIAIALIGLRKTR